ncbi:DnaJ domain-containing protein [Anaerolineales bacterium HSG24]|nr:DnaJ domain-containing protein [Anaerolineales bacterium HSG24]
MKNYYKILGIPSHASNEQIRKVYRKLAQIYHPDSTVLDKDHAHEKFREINEAYEVLAHPEKRNSHDLTLNLRTLRQPERSTPTPSAEYRSKVPPKPITSANQLDFGRVTVENRRCRTFRLENNGGPVVKSSINLSDPENAWFKVSNLTPVSDTDYPMDIEVQVDTSGLETNKIHRGWLEIDLDGKTARVALSVRVTPAPKPEVIPTKLDFGTFYPGETHVLTFMVENIGGPANHKVKFETSSQNKWFHITGYKNQSNSFCPVEVEVTVKSDNLEPGQQYQGWIEADLEGKKAKIFLEAAVAKPPEPEVQVSVTKLETLRKHAEGVWSIAFNPTGDILASSGDDGQVWLWEQNKNWQARQLKFDKWGGWFNFGSSNSAIHHVTFSPDGRFLALAGLEKVMLHELATNKTSQLAIDKTHQSHVVVFTPDSQILLADGNRGELWIWDVATKQEQGRVSAHQNDIQTIAFSPDGAVFVTGGENGRIRLWMLKSQKEVGCFEGHTGLVRSLAFAPDGRLLASAGSLQFVGGHRKNDESVRLWQLQTGQQLKELTGHTKSVEAVTFNPAGTLLASSSVDHTVRLWDVATGLEIGCLTDHAMSVSSIAFSPDGELLASASWDKTINLYNLVVRETWVVLLS